jgi:transposase-like protein
MAATKVSLKLIIDRRRQQVLYAEADKEFVDFLFSIFTLPVGAVTRTLKERGSMVGSLPSLYRGIENMSDTYIQPDKGKSFLLQPKLVMPGAKLPLLLPSLGSTFRQLYSCSNNCRNFVADDNSTICPSCKSKMDQNVSFVDPPSAIRASSSEEGYVKETVKYMVMDDLEVKPSSPTTLVSLFAKFNVKNIGDIEEKVVDVGMDQVCHSSLAFCSLQLPI